LDVQCAQLLNEIAETDRHRSSVFTTEAWSNPFPSPTGISTGNIEKNRPQGAALRCSANYLKFPDLRSRSAPQPFSFTVVATGSLTR
jgi:hypothetical protein